MALGEATGDAGLAGRIRALLGERGRRQVAVALLDGATTTFAGLSASQGTPFEIGSITKVLTGMVLADLAASGVVALDQPVGSLVPGTPLVGARATLSELSQHRSGLPRLPADPAFIARVVLASLLTRNPYRENEAQILAAAARAGANGGARPNYSNLGVATLGSALALHLSADDGSGVFSDVCGDYGTLLDDRVLTPLGMTATTVVTATAGLPVGRAIGRGPTGLRQQPWIAAGWAPAGVGVWSAAQDLARLARAVLDGTAPGASAATPTQDLTDDRRIGLGWITSTIGGRPITWHNGGTGGFASFIGLDRERDRAIVMLSASPRNIDAAALKLLFQPQ